MICVKATLPILIIIANIQPKIQYVWLNRYYKLNGINNTHTMRGVGIYGINIKEYQVEYKDSTYNEELETKLINESMKYYFHCNFGWQGELANGYYLDGLFDTSNGPVALSDQEQEYTSNQYNFEKKLGSLYLAPNK